MKYMNIMVPLLVSTSAGVACFAQSPNLCFVFLAKGDVSVTCDGSTTRITNQSNVESVAVSDEKSSLAITTSRILKRLGDTESSVSITTVIDLSSGLSSRFEGSKGILATCGGLFAANAVATRSTVRDLVTGVEVSIQPYVRFRCTSNRAKIIGVTRSESTSGLYAGLPPSVEIAAAGTFNTYGFAMSPDGSKIAYRDDQNRLCVTSGSRQVQCTKRQATLSDIPTVDNAGEVLIATGTGQECFYHSSSNFSPLAFSGAADENRDECLGIGYWKPGLESLRIISPLGRSPQWITQATGQRLKQWGASVIERSRTSASQMNRLRQHYPRQLGEFVTPDPDKAGTGTGHLPDPRSWNRFAPIRMIGQCPQYLHRRLRTQSRVMFLSPFNTWGLSAPLCRSWPGCRRPRSIQSTDSFPKSRLSMEWPRIRSQSRKS